jgi:hypothetical protein
VERGKEKKVKLKRDMLGRGNRRNDRGGMQYR